MPLRTETRIQHWERRTEWPMALLAIAFLVLYSIDVLDTGLSDSGHRVCRVIDYVIWAIFVVEFLCRLGLAQNRVRYLWHHIPDAAIIALPLLRPLRALRIVMLLRVLNRRATDSLRGKVLIYLVGATILLVYCAALAVLDAERHHSGANITTFGDAVWWSMATVSTVGYGDLYPVTTEGRFVAAGLMVGGIALIGVVTAAFASWLIDRVRDVEGDAQLPTLRDLAELRGQLERIEHMLATLRPERPDLGRDAGQQAPTEPTETISPADPPAPGPGR